MFIVIVFLLLLILVDLILILLSPILFIMMLFPTLFLIVYLMEKRSTSSTRVETPPRSTPASDSVLVEVTGKTKPAERDIFFNQINDLLTRIDNLESTVASLKAEVLERDKIIAELTNKLENSSMVELEDDRQAELEIYKELLASLDSRHSSGEISSEEYHSLKSKFEDKIRRLSI